MVYYNQGVQQFIKFKSVDVSVVLEPGRKLTIGVKFYVMSRNETEEPVSVVSFISCSFEVY